MPVNMERRALIALGLLWLGGVRAVAAIDVTGLWSAAVRSRGGLGYQLTFTATEAALTFGALIDLKYEIAGNKIKMTSGGPDGPPLSSLIAREFTIDGDKLTIDQGDAGPPMVMTRVGVAHAGAHPIVGDWTYMHKTGVPAVQRYGRGDDAQLSVPFETSKGPYRIEGETMHVQLDGRQPLALKIKREGNMLTTTERSGKDVTYVKFEY